jgi:hypothetical protein
VIVTQKCKIKFSINVAYVDELECEVAPLDACVLNISIPCLWERDTNLYKIEKKYHLHKICKSYLIKSHMERERTPLVSIEQGRTRNSKGSNKRLVTFRIDIMVE